MITGIEVLKFGVEDKAEAIKFLSDFGLVQQPSDISEAELFQTQNGSKIYLFDLREDEQFGTLDKNAVKVDEKITVAEAKVSISNH